MATLSQCRSFIDKIAPISQRCNQERKNKVLPSVCIAQACCESAYGTSPKMINANAIFGIKVGKSKWHFGNCWNDKAYSTKTKECYDGKTYTSITDMFRAYDTLQESVGDYYDMLGTCQRYKGCLNLTDAKATIAAIKNGGYATSPTYVNTIMSIINKFDLTRYDSTGMEEEYYQVPTIKTSSIVVALNNIKVPCTLLYRKKIAEKNGISNYSGLYEQNIKMLELLKQGKLKKV